MQDPETSFYEHVSGLKKKRRFLSLLGIKLIPASRENHPMGTRAKSNVKSFLWCHTLDLGITSLHLAHSLPDSHYLKSTILCDYLELHEEMNSDLMSHLLSHADLSH